MVAQIQWLIGAGWTNVKLTPQTVNASTGVWTGTTPVAYFINRWKNIRFANPAETENLSPSDTRRANHVIIETDVEYEVTEQAQTAHTDANPVNAAYTAAYAGYDNYKAEFTAAGKTCTMYLTITGFEANQQGKGGTEHTVRFRLADVGVANPAFA